MVPAVVTSYEKVDLESRGDSKAKTPTVVCPTPSP